MEGRGCGGGGCLDRCRVSSESCVQVVSPSSAPGLILGQGGVCHSGSQGIPSGLWGPLQEPWLRGAFQHLGRCPSGGVGCRLLAPSAQVRLSPVLRAEGPELLINGCLRSEALPLTAGEGGRKEGRKTRQSHKVVWTGSAFTWRHCALSAPLIQGPALRSPLFPSPSPLLLSLLAQGFCTW